jgi:Zn-dependent protease with chaperone function
MQNFFEHQDRARRNTTKLVLLFVLAVVLIVVGVYAALALALAFAGDGFNPRALVQPGLMMLVGIGVPVVIVGGSLFKWIALRQGGHVVAESLGGTRLKPTSASDASAGLSAEERQRLMNVVEEMSIASGVPVPPVYVLDEDGINAFAAGYAPDDAVLGVTRGCVHLLTRAELQGVIAHEYSHILNGDMRTNIRLIGVIHGILLIGLVGRTLMRVAFYSGNTRRRSDDDSKNGIPIFFIGLALFVVGSAGFLCGRMIKSAISRQREFLADASAVQFTRHPEGIAGALKKIGGYEPGAEVEARKAEEISHMFFADAVSGFFSGGAFATHPPLEERIQRIDGSFEGRFPKVRYDDGARPLASSSAAPGAVGLAASGGGDRRAPAAGPGRPADDVVAQAGTFSPDHVAYGAELRAALPEAFLDAVHEPTGAEAVVYALLLDPDDAEVRRAQLRTLRERDAEAARRAEDLFGRLDEVPRRARLPLVDLAAPALRSLGEPQADAFRATLRTLVEADDQLTIFEYALETIVRRRLEHARRPRESGRVRFRRLGPVKDDAVTLLSALAQVGHRTNRAARRAFDEGAGYLPDLGAAEPVAARPQDLDTALDRLAATAPKVKQQVLDACAHVVLDDDTVTVQEGELLRAIAVALESPLPPFLHAVDATDDAPARS